MTTTGPVSGPCSPWLSAEDVAACCDAVDANSDVFAPGWTVEDAIEDAALKASMLLYELSGHRFGGLCERAVRPSDERCRCSWADPRFWRDGASWGQWDGASWGQWWSPAGLAACGCRPLSRVKLAGYPVREISEVLIDGAEVDPSGYRLDGWRWLVRLDDPGPPLIRRRWPGCQNLALGDDQPGTFSVTYSYGLDPPLIAVQAAAELACQLLKACLAGAGAGSSVLPVGVARVSRQGITLEQGLLTQFLYAAKPSGLVAVDGFLSAYGGSSRRTAVYSPDIQPYARRVGG